MYARTQPCVLAHTRRHAERCTSKTAVAAAATASPRTTVERVQRAHAYRLALVVWWCVRACMCARVLYACWRTCLCVHTRGDDYDGRGGNYSAMSVVLTGKHTHTIHTGVFPASDGSPVHVSISLPFTLLLLYNGHF